jgi:hypothetical protein
MKLNFDEYMEIARQQKMKNDPVFRALFETDSHSATDMLVKCMEQGHTEPMRTIIRELDGDIGASLDILCLSSVTREYLSNHPEVRLYKAGVREEARIRRKEEHEVCVYDMYLFETDEDNIESRIKEYRRYQISSNTWSPVRESWITVLDTEPLDFKQVEDSIKYPDPKVLRTVISAYISKLKEESLAEISDYLQGRGNELVDANNIRDSLSRTADKLSRPELEKLCFYLLNVFPVIESKDGNFVVAHHHGVCDLVKVQDK